MVYVVSPGGAPGLVAVGAAKFMQGRFKETIAHCNAAIEMKSDSADAFLLRGASLIGEGDIDRGIADLKEAARLDRDDARIALRLLRGPQRFVSPPTAALTGLSQFAPANSCGGSATAGGRDHDRTCINQRG